MLLPFPDVTPYVHCTAQVLKEGAPGVKKGGEVRQQKWCCGGKHGRSLFLKLLLLLS